MSDEALQKEYQDYQEFQHYQQASSQAANPQTVPDAAQKASQPSGQPYLSPGETATDNYWTKVKARITDPNRWQSIANNTGPSKSNAIGDDLGAANLAIPMGGAPKALQALSGYLGKGGIGPSIARIVANTALGGLQGGAQGALMGAGAGALGEAVGGLIGSGKNVVQTSRMAANRARTQDIALEAIDEATGKLKSSEAENLSRYLGDKTIPIDTTKIRGISPQVDELLSAHASKISPYGDIPSELNIPATDANKIRSLLDQEMTYKKLGPYAQTSETLARDAVIKPQADQLRAQVHNVSPEVSNTLDQWSENLNAARNLDKRAESAPMRVLSSPSFDRRALLQKVDEQVGTNLQDLGTQITNAKALSNAFHGSIHPIDAATALGSAATQGLRQGSSASVPAEMLLQGLFSDSPQTKKQP